MDDFTADEIKILAQQRWKVYGGRYGEVRDGLEVAKSVSSDQIVAHKCVELPHAPLGKCIAAGGLHIYQRVE